MAIEITIDLLYQALTVVLILLVTYILGRGLARFFRETFKKAGIPEAETTIIASISKYFVYIIGISIALNYINIPIVSLWIALVLGVTVIGITARSSLDNIVSGYFLRTYGPFDVGDSVEIDGKPGVVNDITLIKTVIESPEHLFYSIPNSKIIQSEIYNFTRHKSECPVELQFDLSYEADSESVKMEILKIISSYPKVSFEKPVQIRIQQFTGRDVLIKIRFFVPSYEFKLGAEDFVASQILKGSKAGKIPISRPLSNHHTSNRRRN